MKRVFRVIKLFWVNYLFYPLMLQLCQQNKLDCLIQGTPDKARSLPQGDFRITDGQAEEVKMT